MSTEKRDPWVDVQTVHGLPADQVISTLQKEIRRDHTENAVLLVYDKPVKRAYAELRESRACPFSRQGL